jgi:hypothetical protein
MKKQSIKIHLAPYSILRKRKTTINHAFASAIAPVDEYDQLRLDAALRLLAQDPDDELRCVYCGLLADTWDHLLGLVENTELRGYGHQIGNLVPCCRDCNSKKGAKGWERYLREVVPDDSAFEARRSVIASYLKGYATAVDLKRAAGIMPAEWARYGAIRQEIFRLMTEADTIASRLRAVVAVRDSG